MPTIDNSFDYNYDNENDDDMIELPPMTSSSNMNNFDNSDDEDDVLNNYNTNDDDDNDDDDDNNDNLSSSSQQLQQQCGLKHYIIISLLSFIAIGNAYLHYSANSPLNKNNSSSSSLRSSSGFLGQYAKTAIGRGHRMHGNIDIHPGMDRYRSYVAVRHKKKTRVEEEEEMDGVVTPEMTTAAAGDGGETNGKETTTTTETIIALPTADTKTTGGGGDLGRLGSEDDFGGRDFLVVDTWDHDPTSFTQGLTYGRNKYYESTGLRGQSKVRILNRHGKLKKSIDMESQYFGEGLTFFGNNRLIQITWQKRKGFIYKAKNLKLVKSFDFSTTRNQGWGITYDHPHRQFIVTDGSNKLHFWDRQTLQETKPRVPVIDENGQPISNLNEIEYTPKGILSNIWYTDDIILIDPETGRVKRRFDLSTLWPKRERPPSADVLNGISVTDVEDLFLVTGKKWPKIYKVKFQGWDEIE